MDELDQLTDQQLAGWKSQNQAVLDKEVLASPEKLDALSDEELTGLKQRQHEVLLAPFREQARAGQGAYSVSEGVVPYLGRQFVSPIRSLAMGPAYGVAKDRLNRNEHSDSDLRAIAAYEHEQGLDQAQPEWAKWAGVAAAAPGTVAEFGLAPGLSFAAHAGAGAIAQGGLNAESLLKGGAQAAVQVGVLKSLGPIAKTIFPQAEGILATAGTHALTGSVGLALADYGTKLAGLSESGGPIGEALAGHYGEAARGFVANAVLTFGTGAFGAIQKGYSKKVATEKAVENVQKVAEQAATGAVQEEARSPKLKIGDTEVLTPQSKDLNPAERYAVDKYGENKVLRVGLNGPDGPMGSATLAEEGDTIHVAWVGKTGLAGGEGRGKNLFGAREVFSLATQLAEAMPDAKFLKYTVSEGRIGEGKAKIVDLDAIRRRGQPKAETPEAPTLKTGSPQTAPEGPVINQGGRATLDELQRQSRESGRPVRVFRGEGFHDNPQHTAGSPVVGKWYTTDLAEAQRYADENKGTVRYIDLQPTKADWLGVNYGASKPTHHIIVTDALKGREKPLTSPTLKTGASEPRPEPYAAAEIEPLESPPTMSADEARGWLAFNGLKAPESDAVAIAKAEKLVAEAKAKGAVGVKRPTGEAPPEGPSAAEQVGAKQASVGRFAGMTPEAAERSRRYLESLGPEPPPPEAGMVRLYRGTKTGEIPHEHAFFTDESGLAGVAVPFARVEGRNLSYVDVPAAVAKAGHIGDETGASEYKLPKEYRRRIKTWGKGPSGAESLAVRSSGGLEKTPAENLADSVEDAVGRMVEDMASGPYYAHEQSRIMSAWRTVRAAAAKSGGTFAEYADPQWVAEHVPRDAGQVNRAIATIAGYHRTLNQRYGGWEPPEGWDPTAGTSGPRTPGLAEEAGVQNRMPALPPAPSDPLADAYRNKGITKRDQRLHQAAIAGEDSLRSAARKEGLSPEGVRKAIKRVDEKVGQEFSAEAMRAKEKAAREELHRGGVEVHGEEPAAKPRPLTAVERQSKKLDDLGDLIMRQAEQGKLSPEAMARHKAEADRIAGVEALKEARQAGIPPEHVEAMADDILAEHKESIREWQSLYRDAYDALKEFGVTPQKLHGILTRAAKDPASIKGMDEVAQDLAEKYPSFFRLKTEHASDTLASILLKGKPQSMTVAEARETAADRLAKNGVDGATKAALRSGDTQADVAESIRRGKEASDAELSAGQAEEGAGEGGEFAFGALGGAGPDPARVAALMKQGFNRKAAEERAALEAAKQQHPQQAMGAAALGELTHEAQAPEDPRLTSIAHAQSVDTRRALGLAAEAKRQGYPDELVMEAARAVVQADPGMPQKLIAELEKRNRPTDPIETVILLRESTRLDNEIDRARSVYGADPDGKSLIDGLKAEQKRLLDVTDPAGSSAGAAFRLRRAMMDEDYTIVGLEKRAEQAKGKPLTEAEKEELAKLHDRLREAEAELEKLRDQVGTGQKPGRPSDAKVNVDKVKDEITTRIQRFEDENKPWWAKALDKTLEVQRFSILSGGQTIEKLSAAAGVRVVLAPIRQAVAAGLGKLPFVRQVAAQSPRWGRLSPKAEVEAITTGLWTGLKAAKERSPFGSGQSAADVAYGEGKYARKPGITGRVLNAPGEVHGALKAVPFENEFARSARMREEFYRKQGLATDTPSAQERIGKEAYRDAEEATMQRGPGDVIADWFNDLVAKGKKRDADGNYRFLPYLGATALKSRAPIVRVPMNVVGEALRGLFGTVTGSAGVADAIAKGVKNLPPDRADLVMKRLTDGSMGAFFLTLGAMGYAQMGGLHVEGDRRKKKLGEGQADVFGVTLPKDVLHDPRLILMQAGATAVQQAERHVKGQPLGKLAGAGAAVGATLREVPFVRDFEQTNQFLSPNTQAHATAEMIKSLALPQLVQWLARELDKPHPFSPAEQPTPRKAETFWENVKLGIPGKRETLKKK